MAKQVKEVNREELGLLTEVLNNMEGKRVPRSIGEDESSAKQAKEADSEELQPTEAKAAASNAIAQAIAQLQHLQVKVESSESIKVLKNHFWMCIPDIEKSIKSLTGLHAGPMTGASEDVLGHIFSFLDRNEQDSFVLVSRQMHSVLESLYKKALDAFLKQLKESHYVDEGWLTRVKEYAEATGASTYRRQLVCAPQVNLYSAKAGEDFDIYGKHRILPERSGLLCCLPKKDIDITSDIDGRYLVLPGRNEILCSLPLENQSIEVLDLKTREWIRTFCSLPDVDDEDFDRRSRGKTLSLCGTHVVVHYMDMALIFTMDGDLVQNVNIGRINSWPRVLSIAPFDGGSLYYCSPGNEGQAILSQINVQSGQTTQHQLNFAYSNTIGVYAAGRWLVCWVGAKELYVIDPTNFAVMSHFDLLGGSTYFGVACSADSDFVVIKYRANGPSTNHLVDILSINADGKLNCVSSHSYSFYCDVLSLMIHDTTLYILRDDVIFSRNRLLRIDAINMPSGRKLGRLSYLGGDLRESGPQGLFVDNNEVFVALAKDDYLYSVMAFPMVKDE